MKPGVTSVRREPVQLHWESDVHGHPCNGTCVPHLSRSGEGSSVSVEDQHGAVWLEVVLKESKASTQIKASSTP